jgi:molybdopterin converting factor small subunit
MAKLVFLGRLEDLAGFAEIAVPLAGSAPLSAIVEDLAPELVDALRSPKIRVAHNGALVAAEVPLGELVIADADEIAFLPPVSGG